MKIVNFEDDQFLEYLDLVEVEFKTAGSTSRLREDFPLLFSRNNREMVLGILSGGKVAAGLGCLVRQFETSCGAIPVAGIGGVVTRSEYRGRGFSRALQSEVLGRLAKADIPLAVLWTDRPACFAGRGFTPAGWEFHVDLSGLPESHFPAGFTCRDFRAGDVEAAAALYDRHPFRTLRQPGDAASLYTMPGTRGLVAAGGDGQVAATAFCGKGSDFSDYVLEWSGPVGLVIPLLGEARRRNWCRHLLAPPGGDKLAEQLNARGTVVTARPAGHWVVVQPEQLSRYLQAAGRGTPRNPADPTAILGTVDRDGVIVPGALNLAVWGFDSV